MMRTGLVLCAIVVGLVGCDAPLSTRNATPELPNTSPAQTPTTRFAATQPASGEPTVLEPSQGRPIILRPDDRFYFLMQLGDAIEGDVYVSLIHSLVPEVYFPLSLAEGLTLQPGRHASMVLQIPSDVPEGLYDLRVRGVGKTLTTRHSVKVVRQFKDRFRFVHLSDMHIGDPTAPFFDERLPEEINLLAPEFILATGDFLTPTTPNPPEQAWQHILDYLARFNAPVYVLCGTEDDETSFAPTVAASPIGSFDYGPYHGVLLLNHGRRPLDAGQIEFVRRDLADRQNNVFNFLAMNDDDPRVIPALAGDDAIATFIEANRIRMLICGGSRDWDGREYADVLTEMTGLHYVRTHAASPCRRDGASGVSHYRVFEVSGQDVAYVYPADHTDGLMQHSVPAGKLAVTLLDGSARPTEATAVIRNGLNQPFADCRVWLRLAKRGATPPKIAGGQLVQALDGRTFWLCEVSVDVPDRGGVRVSASIDAPLPEPPPIAVKVVADEPLVFTPTTTPAGLTYARSSGRLEVHLTNVSSGAVIVSPIVRLLGEILPVVSPSRPAWPVTIDAGETITLRMNPVLAHAIEGPHYVQVAFAEDSLGRLHLHRVLIERGAAATQPAQ